MKGGAIWHRPLFWVMWLMRCTPDAVFNRPVALGLDGGDAIDLMGGIKVATGHAHAEITADAFYDAAIAAFAVGRRAATAFIGLQTLATFGFKAGIAAGIAAARDMLKPFKGAGRALTFAIVADITFLLGQAVGVLAA